MAAKGSEFEQEMVQLEAELRKLEAEYNMFFAGRLPRLPWETRSRVEALVKRYDRMSLRNTAERFRFGMVQARFASFCDLWDRSLKAKEEGRQPGRRPRTGGSPPVAAPPPVPVVPPTAKAPAPPVQPPPPPPSTIAPPAARTRDDVLHVASFRNPADAPDKVQQLYERLSEARRAAGEDALPYERFNAVVSAQMRKLGGGDSEVAFKVSVKDGKVTLTANKKDE